MLGLSLTEFGALLSFVSGGGSERDSRATPPSRARAGNATAARRTPPVARGQGISAVLYPRTHGRAVIHWMCAVGRIQESPARPPSSRRADPRAFPGSNCVGAVACCLTVGTCHARGRSDRRGPRHTAEASPGPPGNNMTKGKRKGERALR